ncbi:hypothetical protein Tco_0307826 [Tanacetum coccineum]
MTKVMNGEFEILKDLNDKDVSPTCGTSLEVFNKEFNRMSRMDDDLFTNEVEVANIPCDSNKDDDSEQRVSHEANNDMGYDPSDIAFTEWLGEDDEVELTDEEFFDNEDEVSEVFRIDTHTYEEYKDDWIYEWNRDVPWVDEKPWTDTRVWTEPTPFKHYFGNSLHYQDHEWYEALKDSELKEQALRNKAIMKGLIKYKNETHDERQKLCETHELTVCNMRRFKMIKYSFGQDEEYVAVKEDKYDDLARTSDDACRAYQEIFAVNKSAS